MLRLILMRHAKSDWSHAGLGDHARPLNKRGRASAKALGYWMRSKEYWPDEVLCSTAERTGETLLRLDFNPPLNTRFVSGLYHAEAEEMLGILHGAKSACVLMIGHNPGICEMANRLVEAPPSHDRFFDYPTAATLVCDFDKTDWRDVTWFSGEEVDFVIPRELITEK